ncbi:TIR domain-containing protein [Actinomadura sp. K4S16]|uniref:TIR domain-containing protein n=1 Tax=Actinomadura sp. K4S16 TaxID=1316147 RepID=UPI001357E8FA|nr:TIR domain-containing protein [Actinomadura sp. K4S16]
MKVFLSWSGDKSKAVAEVLKTWLPDVIQAIEPWVSSQDIAKGSRGLKELADELKGSDFGIVCITSDNQDAKWINFEAGALSKIVEGSYVVPFLLDINVQDLSGPLAQFQATRSNSKEDVKKLIFDINEALGANSISVERLERAFERNWEDLDSSLRGVREQSQRPMKASRSDSEILAEILVLVRQQERRLVDLESLVSNSQVGIAANISDIKTLSRVSRQEREDIANRRESITDQIVVELGKVGFREFRINFHDDVINVISDPPRANFTSKDIDLSKTASLAERSIVIQDTKGRIIHTAHFPF